MSTESPCTLCALARTTGPDHLASLQECEVVLGENQGNLGWCVAILREHAEHMDDLPPERQARVWGDVARVARAIRRVFAAHGEGGGPVRLNYECLGNVVPHIHWHIVPRHEGEPDLRAAVWLRSPEALRGSLTQGERQHLAARLRDALKTL
ncbi:MAG: HIT family protein [Phycisphaerales bacterium]|nr:HIT family protein [Phycisphaerales bacterium]